MSFLERPHLCDNPPEPHGFRDLPLPTAGYRRRSWTAFQRALDPLAVPKPLRPPRF